MYKVPTVNFGTSNSQTTLNNIVNNPIQQIQKNYSKQEFFDDIDKIKQAKGLDDMSAYYQVANYYKQKGYSVQGIDLDSDISDLSTRMQDQKSQEEDKGFFEALGNVIKERGNKGAQILSAGVQKKQGTLESGVQYATNLLGGLADVVGTGIMEGLDAVTPEVVQDKLKEGIKTAMDTKGGQWVGQKLAEAQKNFEDLQKYNPRVARNFQAIADTINTGLTFVGGGATGKAVKSGALKTAGETALKGVKTVGEKIINAPGKIINKASEKLVDTSFKFTPSQTKKVVIATNGKSTGQWLLEKNIIQDAKILKGNEGIINDLQAFNSNAYETLNKSISQAKGVFKVERVDDALKALKKEVGDIPGLEDKFNRIRELAVKSSRGEGLTLSEILETKRFIDDTLDLYKITGEPKTASIKEGLQNIRSDIRRFIEQEAERQGLADVAGLSNDIRVSRIIKDNLVNRLETASPNRIFSLTDILVGGGAALGADPVTAIALIAGKKILESPQFKIFAIKTLKLPELIINKIGKGVEFVGKERIAVGQAIKNYIQEKGALIADDLADKIGARSKLLSDKGTGISGEVDNSLIDLNPKLPKGNGIDYGKIEQYYKNKLGTDDVSEIMQKVKRQNIETQQNIMKKAISEKKNINKTNNDFYGMEHRPTENGATADNISKNGVIPEDIYTNPEYYFNPNDTTYKESFSVLKKIKGNPNEEVTIYRAGIKDEFNRGDWITLSKTYAKEHMERFGSKGVFSKKVKAKDIQFAGDDINEFGYFPKQNPINKKGFIKLNPKLPKKVDNETIFLKMKNENIIPFDITENWRSKFNKYDIDLSKYKEGDIIPYRKVIKGNVIPNFMKKNNIDFMYTDIPNKVGLIKDGYIYIQGKYGNGVYDGLNNYIEKKYGLSIDEYFLYRKQYNQNKIIEGKLLKKEIRENNLGDLLDFIQTKSDNAKKSGLSINKLEDIINNYERKGYYGKDYDKYKKYLNSSKFEYGQKSNNIGNAINLAKKENIKTILGLDEKKIPVIYFELPNGQASFHLPNIDPIKYSEQYGIEYKPSYKWSGKKNTPEIIQKYKQIYEQAHKK